MGFSFLKNSKFYGRYLNKNLNSKMQMINFGNYYYFSTLNSVLNNMRVNNNLNTLDNSVSGDGSIVLKGTNFDLALLKDAFQYLLSVPGISQISIFKLISVCRQWSGLDLKSVVMNKEIAAHRRNHS